MYSFSKAECSIKINDVVRVIAKSVYAEMIFKIVVTLPMTNGIE